MTKKTKRLTTEKGFPIDERPVVFNLNDSPDVNYVGRYIKSESMFMLSINDTNSDFVSEKNINEWWYIDEHPIIIEEVITQKDFKKSKVKKEEKPKYRRKKDDSESKSDSENKSGSEPTSETHNFSIPRSIKGILNQIPQTPLPPFLRDFVRNIEQETGVNFQAVNVRVLGEDDLFELPKEVLEQILEQALSDENFELATKIRDAINSK
jgi:hypothetical protein